MSGFQQWISEMATRKVGKRFKWFKEEFTGFMQLEKKKDVIADPAEYMAEKRTAWADLWCERGAPFETPLPLDLAQASLDDDFARTLDLMRDLREQESNCLEPIDPARLERFLRRMGNATGKGVESMAPRDYADLPEPALRELCKVFGAVEETWTWPWHFCCNLINLVEKPGGQSNHF